MNPASLTIVTKNKLHVLLVLRKDVPVWVLPGGGIETNETPADCATRETFEETGVRIKNVEHVATYTSTSRFSALTHVFHAEPFTCEIPYLSYKEVQAIRFFSIDALPERFFFVHRTILEEYLSDKKKPIERPLSEISWKTVLSLFFSHPFHSVRFLWTKLLHS